MPSTRRSLNRRAVLKMLAAGTGALAASGLPGVRARASGWPYRVGVGVLPDHYDATLAAIVASGEFPDVLGRDVYIKPNLVAGAWPDDGITTDPQVVRAIVDTALAAGALSVHIIESRPYRDWNATGYQFFDTYHPQVFLESISLWPLSYVPVPGGMAYDHLYLATALLDPNVVFISAAKLKTHSQAHITLTQKNLFGLPSRVLYYDEETGGFGRWGMHARSVPQTTVDLTRARPIDFAVVDGIIGMEGMGPRFGDPVRMDLVLAGCNAQAVDVIGTEVMGIDPQQVLHLVYAGLKGMGPLAANAAGIVVAGDPLPMGAFTPPRLAAQLPYPDAPDVFATGGGSTVNIQYAVSMDIPTRVEIATVDDDRPWDFTRVATVRPFTWTTAGTHSVSWDGTDNAGTLLPPGKYAIRVAAHKRAGSRHQYAFRWITLV